MRVSWSLRSNLVRLRNCEDFIHVLKPDDQRIVTMRLDGTSVGDIAEEMGLTLTAIYVRLSVVAKKLENARDGIIPSNDTEEESSVPFYAATHKQIAVALGVSRVRVQQIEAKALKKLRSSRYGRELVSALCGAH